MSTRILKDNEFTRPNDIIVNLENSKDKGQRVWVGGFPAQNMNDGMDYTSYIVLREVNASCRCLSETEMIRNGDVAIYGDREETTAANITESFAPLNLPSWINKHIDIDDPTHFVVAVIRYEK
jgi:hypothetical protein